MNRAACGPLTVILAAAALAAAGAEPAAPQAGGRRPDIVLITIDTLRADHLGVYGYSRPTSPNVDALAREAVVVSHAIAQAPYTKASIASLLTGLFPTAHKVLAVVTSNPGRGGQLYTDVLGPEPEVLPETLGTAGYETHAVVAHHDVRPEHGFARGFTRFDLVPDDGRGTTAGGVLNRVLELFDRPKRRPLFVWVHLFEPHNPYTPPEPYRSMFPPRSPSRPIPSRVKLNLYGIGDSRDLELLVARYDGEIRAVDAALGTFFGALRARGLWRDTAIVLTSDHGEEFLEHGVLNHSASLYDTVLRVPLIVKAPGLVPRLVQGQAQLVDLFPTLARLAGTAPRTRLHGADLAPVLQGRAAPEPYAYAELARSQAGGDRSPARLFALRTMRWKYVSTLQGYRRLYDLSADPGERENVADREGRQAVELERMLARMVGEAVQAGAQITQRPVPLSPTVIERLRALGYLR